MPKKRRIDGAGFNIAYQLDHFLKGDLLVLENLLVGDADHDFSHSSVELRNVKNENLSCPTSSMITAAAIS